MASVTPSVRAAISRFRQRVESRYTVDALILFGSWCRGTADDYSDVDLLVVSPDFLPQNRLEVIEFLADAALEASPDWQVPLAPIPISTERLRQARADIFAVARDQGLRI